MRAARAHGFHACYMRGIGALRVELAGNVDIRCDQREEEGKHRLQHTLPLDDREVFHGCTSQRFEERNESRLP